MTDEELKQLVASLAVAQQKTDEELNKLAVNLAVSQQKADERMQRMDEQFKHNEEQFKRDHEQFKLAFEQLKRNDEKLERIGLTWGNISRNQGDVAEEFFYNTLSEDIRLGSIHFDDISRNEQKRRGKTEEEYDIIMTNGNSIGVVEVKYKAHPNDLQKLERKVNNFKKLFPVYEKYKIYGALASFHIHDEIKNDVLQKGFFVLQRQGQVIHTECGQNLLVL